MLLYTDRFCTDVAGIHPNILITTWLKNGKGVAWHIAPGALLPADDRAATMGIQVELIKSIVQTSEDIFGKTRYIMSSLAKADCYNFVLKDPDYVFCMVIARPYDHNVVDKVLNMLLA
ncbi:MAG: hypothetical protein ABI347_11220 [Nitrososphaera sp.]